MSLINIFIFETCASVIFVQILATAKKFWTTDCFCSTTTATWKLSIWRKLICWHVYLPHCGYLLGMLRTCTLFQLKLCMAHFKLQSRQTINNFQPFVLSPADRLWGVPAVYGLLSGFSRRPRWPLPTSLLVVPQATAICRSAARYRWTGTQWWPARSWRRPVRHYRWNRSRQRSTAVYVWIVVGLAVETPRTRRETAWSDGTTAAEHFRGRWGRCFRSTRSTKSSR